MRAREVMVHAVDLGTGIDLRRPADRLPRGPARRRARQARATPCPRSTPRSTSRCGLASTGSARHDSDPRRTRPGRRLALNEGDRHVDARTHHQRPAPDAIVVGGGIGGLGAALALSRKGIRVRLLESCEEFGEVGAGLQIAPNCTRILHEYGLLDEVRALGVQPESHGHEGRRRRHRAHPARPRRPRAPLRLPLPGHPPQRPARHPAARLPARPAWSCSTARRSSATRTPPAAPASSSPTAGPSEAEVVIAADGLHSVARSWSRRRAGQLGLRRLPGGRADRRRSATHDVSETDVVVYVGPRCHFVQYPLRGGEMFNQVAVFESPKALGRRGGLGHPRRARRRLRRHLRAGPGRASR